MVLPSVVAAGGSGHDEDARSGHTPAAYARSGPVDNAPGTGGCARKPGLAAPRGPDYRASVTVMVELVQVAARLFIADFSALSTASRQRCFTATYSRR